MPIQFKAPAVSALLNQTFLDKTIDDLKRGKFSLYKTATNEVGFVDDVQNYLNEIADTTGQIFEGDVDRKNYSSNNFIADGDNRKVAIEKLDIAVKFNLDEISDLNTAFANYLQNGSFKIRGYISDNAYESANGAPLGGEIYYNQTTGSIRFYNNIDAQWGDVGKKVLGVQEVPIGIVNGVNTSFDISTMPINDEAMNVFLNGVLVPKSDYSFSSPTITFTTAPSLGQKVYISYLSEGNPSTPVISAGTNNVFYYEVTAGDIIAKSFTLPSIPVTAGHVLADVIGGTTLQYGSDFTIASDQFDWDGLSLDGLISSGDIIRVQYFN